MSHSAVLFGYFHNYAVIARLPRQGLLEGADGGGQLHCAIPRRPERPGDAVQRSRDAGRQQRHHETDRSLGAVFELLAL